MDGQINISDEIQTLGRLSRNADLPAEPGRFAAAGTRTANWVVKIISHDSFNLYNVEVVEINFPGSNPALTGMAYQAFNLAESFTQTGSGPAVGKYAVMSRLGSVNVFNVQA